ncbi:NfeD family protein [Alcaligenaceae bacterium SJ-26]|nr:NfeD family protein [Alcaligenaceae bacterium SJ-26]
MWIWFGLAALALIGELSSGTFYLLLIALGFAGGGLAALAGLALPWQLVACALISLLGLLTLRKSGFLKKREVNSARNADVNLDIGRSVQVSQWGDNGLAAVQYRGATWQAELEPGAARTTGAHEIVALRGSRLVVRPR